MEPHGRKKQVQYSCHTNTNILNTICKKQNKEGKYFFLGIRLVGVSIVLARHTLQQGNVVSFQHDPPWEIEEEKRKREKSKWRWIRRARWWMKETQSVSSLLDKAQECPSSLAADVTVHVGSVACLVSLLALPRNAQLCSLGNVQAKKKSFWSNIAVLANHHLRNSTNSVRELI